MMDQSSNGLNTSAYDLACHYNNLFQYNPAAAAVACAAAYGNMFNPNTLTKNPSASNLALHGSFFHHHNLHHLSSNSNNNTSTTTTATNSASSPANSSLSSSSSSSTTNHNLNPNTNLELSPNNLFNNKKSKSVNYAIKREANDNEDVDLDDEDDKIVKNKCSKVGKTPNSFESISDESELEGPVCQKQKIEDETRNKANNEDEILKTKEVLDNSLVESASSPSSSSSSVSSTSSASSSRSSSPNSSRSSSPSASISRAVTPLPNNTNKKNTKNYDEDILQHESISSVYSKSSIEKMQQNLNNETEKIIEKCFDEEEFNNQGSSKQKRKLDHGEDLILNNKRHCVEEQPSLGSILNSLSHQNGHSLIIDEKFKPKFTQQDLEMFKFQLINSVNHAIHTAFENFYKIKQENSKKIDEQVNLKSTPSNPTITHPSKSFDMSKLLDENNNKNKYKVNEIKQAQAVKCEQKTFNNNKEILIPNGNIKSNLPKPEAKTAFSASSLLNLPHDSAFLSKNPRVITNNQTSLPQNPSTTMSANNKPISGVNQFFPMSHNNNSNSQTQLNNNKSPNFAGGFTPFTNGSSSTNLLPSNQNGFSGSSLAAQHQFFLAAAAAQNSNYFNMAAVNRLFTPYLIDHHQPGGATNGSPVLAKTNPTPQHTSQQHTPVFNATPSKRRRTKVTDTRLSPRNPTAPIRTGTNSFSTQQQDVYGRSHLIQSGGSIMNGSGSSHNRSPSQSGNEIDDQENFNQDYDDLKYDDDDNQNRQNSQEDESISSNDNNGHQLATMPNGCYNLLMNSSDPNGISQGQSLNDPSSASNEYIGYQISF